jgi:rRNA maturation endonuclease Nob1
VSRVESKSIRRRSDVTEKAGPVMKSACMTGDYAMQNVALQMGLNLVSMEGGGVRHVKTWVLRCHGCFTYLLIYSQLIQVSQRNWMSNFARLVEAILY